MSDEILLNCRLCKHCHMDTESWEMPWIRWWECKKIPGRANLGSFPFRRTKCPEHTERHRLTEEQIERMKEDPWEIFYKGNTYTST